MNVNSLAHTKWECKYHIVFAPKYRRQVIYKRYKSRCRTNIRIIMQKKRNRNNRSRVLSGSYTYASKNTT